MTTSDLPQSAEFLSRVRDFLALQAHFSRQFNLLPSHWLTLYSALVSVRFEQGEWICNEFSTAEIARDSLTSRETVRRSMQWLVAKGLIIRTHRRFALTALTLAHIRKVLDGQKPASHLSPVLNSHAMLPTARTLRAPTTETVESNF